MSELPDQIYAAVERLSAEGNDSKVCQLH